MGCTRALCISALFLICSLFYPCHALGTITQTLFISDSEDASLVSSDGNFKLGFFSSGKTEARYVGIWLNKISEHTVIWVANRATPVMNSAGVFKIGGDGNLGVFCCNQSSPLWSTNISVPAGTTTAKLLDSGNLVLVAEERIIWQSFDNPTDTILPGMRFGLNWKTGLNHILTSWKSIDDPTPGEFTARFDPNGIPQIYLYKNSDPYWRCGPWNGRNLNGLPDIATRLQDQNVDYSGQIDPVSYAVVNDENGSYYTFSSKNSKLFSILVLEPIGTMKRLIWHDNQKLAQFWMAPQDLCDEYDRCGANGFCTNENVAHCACLPGFQPSYPQDFFLNCAETRKMDGCGKGDGEGFIRMGTVKLPDTKNSTLFSNMNLKDCERECLKSCNCTGYAILDVTGSGRGCITWYGELRDMRPYQYGQDFYLRVDAVELAADARKRSKHFLATTSTLVFIIVPVVVEMLLVAMCFYYLWRRQVKKRKGQKQKKPLRQDLFLDLERSLSIDKGSPNSSGQSGDIELTLFELSTVEAATSNFSPSNKLGRGGFGPVYKGRLPNGQDIAVKRLSKNSEQGSLEFKNEVLLIAKLQHRNLVRLLGCCMEKEEKILIYEFMPNKSLNDFVFDQSRKLLLDWKTRFDIILGIARGILYLHQDSRLRIIHRDLKVSNILLDGEMTPKISDFGLARILSERDQNQGNTKRVVGTYGYMSPEYTLDGIFSIKSDVFSFGVILLEIISGKKNRGFFHDDPYSNLIQHTWELWRDEKALEIVDSSITDSCSADEVVRCIQVGLLCVQDNARDRPSMSTVVFMLSNETTLPSPKKSTFAFRKNELNSSPTRTKCSINEVTITTCNAR